MGVLSHEYYNEDLLTASCIVRNGPLWNSDGSNTIIYAFGNKEIQINLPSIQSYNTDTDVVVVNKLCKVPESYYNECNSEICDYS